MQPLQYLDDTLAALAGPEHYLFSASDLRALLPNHAPNAFRALLHRAEGRGILERICRGLYRYGRIHPAEGLLLFHAAARLRAETFNYISLETALSDAGVISQMPLQWITLMSAGRSSRISCGAWGTIEFVHTAQLPADLAGQLSYDPRCHLWRANVSQAIRDMRMTRRSLDLIDWSLVNESV